MTEKMLRAKLSINYLVSLTDINFALSYLIYALLNSTKAAYILSQILITLDHRQKHSVMTAPERIYLLSKQECSTSSAHKKPRISGAFYNY